MITTIRPSGKGKTIGKVKKKTVVARVMGEGGMNRQSTGLLGQQHYSV